MNRLSREDRVRIVSALVEGNSIRATVRMTGFSKNTVNKLLIELGAACASYQDAALRNLGCKRVQCDEIWSYCYAKDKNVPSEMKGTFGVGSVWTWVAIDADSKLVCTWMVGTRDAYAAHMFMQDLAGRLAHRVQLTTDGLKVYASAVEAAFGSEIDYAMLVKVYGENAESEKRYSPAECIGCHKEEISGKPDQRHISTSFVERQNLTMRMHMRRYTRLTNAFSKKIENHIAANAVHFMYYNFAKIHQTLRVTPAMAAGVTDTCWEVGDIVALLEEREAVYDAQAEERAVRGILPSGSTLGH